MSRPRVGFLGTGWIGRHRMQAMVDTGAIEATAIVDPSRECVEEALRIAPDAGVLPSFEAMLEAGLDGIVIATPSAMHAEQAIAALDRGIAVFCQKPLGRNAAEVDAVIGAARRADRLLSVDLSYRRTAAMEAIVGLVRGGDLGKIFAVDLVFHNAYGPDKPWFYDKSLAGGGCVMDLAVHQIDLALWALDFPAVRHAHARLLVQGRPVDPAGNEVEDFATAELTLADGAAVRLACSWRLHAGRDAVIETTFYGTQGAAGFRNIGGSFYDFEAFRHSGTKEEILAGPPDDWGGRMGADWALQLAQDRGFREEAGALSHVAVALDAIYAAGNPGRFSGSA
jgi:predicted dehydrogenase